MCGIRIAQKGTQQPLPQDESDKSNELWAPSALNEGQDTSVRNKIITTLSTVEQKYLKHKLTSPRPPPPENQRVSFKTDC